MLWTAKILSTAIYLNQSSFAFFKKLTAKKSLQNQNMAVERIYYIMREFLSSWGDTSAVCGSHFLKVWKNVKYVARTRVIEI